jgi:arylsulfatase A-like enzyme
MARSPDIVLLVLDTQRADRLSCYGCPEPTTPALDALARESTLFRYAFSAAQWTIPSHASMFTGVYPAVHNTVQSFSRLPAMLPTLAERLRDRGYFTAAFCNNPLVGVINNGLRRGFYSFLNYSGLLTSRPNQAGVRRGLLDRYRQWFKNRVVDMLSSVQDAFARSETLLALSFTPLMVPLWQTALSFKGNTARSLSDAAKLLIERRGVADDQPIFSFINLMGAHMPYRPPRPFVERFAPHVLHDRRAQHYLRHFNTDIYGWYAPLGHTMDDERKAILDGMYNAEVAHQDAQVDRFLEALRNSGKLDDMVIITCADHGDHLGEKQLVGHIFSTYNELVRVPLMVRVPSGDFARGAMVDDFVSTRRIFHTTLALAGAATPEEENLSLAQSRASDPDSGTVFVEAIPSQQVVSMLQRRKPHLVDAYGCHDNRSAVCSDGYKLIQVGDNRPQLYNVLDDLHEHHDLHDVLPEKVNVLQQNLQGFAQAACCTPPAHDTPQNSGLDDPTVVRRLRDLGYLE